MKYEIIKGSEKDFEGAPDWARLVVEHCEFTYNTWFYESDKVGGKWKQCKGQLRGVIERDGIGNWLNVIAERRRRPITEPELKPIYGDGIHDDGEALQQRIDMGIDVSNIIGKQGKLFNVSKPLQFGVVKDSVVDQPLTTEWNGEGLPTVGVECEIKRVSDWIPVTIKFISGYYTVILTRGGTEDAYQTSALQFRPIRSPDDVARDEVKAIIAELCRSSATSEIAADLIYDAIAAGKIPGVTKTPTVSELMRVTENATREDCEAIVKMLSGK